MPPPCEASEVQPAPPRPGVAPPPPPGPPPPVDPNARVPPGPPPHPGFSQDPEVARFEAQEIARGVPPEVVRRRGRSGHPRLSQRGHRGQNFSVLEFLAGSPEQRFNF
eukprot:12836602-Alexandrium_andersonii.AAC.1